MGTAMLLGLIKAKDADSELRSFAAHVTSQDSALRIKRQLQDIDKKRVTITHEQSEVVRAVTDADVVLLGVQPKDLQDLLKIPDLPNALQSKTIISMLAGVPVAEILEALSVRDPTSRRARTMTVARVIPSPAASRGDSVTLVAEPESTVDIEQFARVEEVLSCVGSIVRVPESLMNAATAAGAAVHALSFVAVDAATDASVAAGLPREVARAIVAESLRSCSGLMCGKDSMSPEQVKAAMSTPGGITLNSVVNLDASTRSGVASTVKGAIDYANQMNK